MWPIKKWFIQVNCCNLFQRAPSMAPCTHKEIRKYVLLQWSLDATCQSISLRVKMPVKFSVGAFSASASAPPILTALHQVETLHNIWLLTADWRHYVTTDFPPDCSAASLCDPFMDRHVLPQLWGGFGSGQSETANALSPVTGKEKNNKINNTQDECFSAWDAQHINISTVAAHIRPELPADHLQRGRGWSPRGRASVSWILLLQNLFSWRLSCQFYTITKCLHNEIKGLW